MAAAAAAASASATAALDAAVAALHAEGAREADTLAGAPLRACALRVLREPDAERKAALTFAVAAAFERGLLALDGDDADPAPDRPARPEGVRLVAPLRVKSSTRRHMLHSLVHAESYAIDLAWDLVARFGWSPRTWGLPLEAAEAAAGSAPQVGASGGASGSDGGALREPEAAADNDGASREPEAAADAAVAAATGCADAGAAGSRLPESFFKTWVRVAAEEAKHFSRWRLRLLAAHSTRYGDLPAHEGLWQSALETRGTLLARLSVVHCVHEARGLDVSPLMRSKLGDDAASVAVLDANVEEEVTHVAAGREWIEFACAALEPRVDPRKAFRACVRAFFFGALRPPFAAERRQRAGLTGDWWLPLVEKPAEGAIAAEPQLTAEDMG